MLETLRCEKNVQNRQLATWLTEEEYVNFESEWESQQQIREDLKEKPEELKRYENKLHQATFNDNLVVIPTNLTKTTIKKRLNKLLAQTEVNPTAEQTAKYSIAKTKVDVESLKTCLMAYDLKQQGLDILDIGLQAKWIGSAEAKDLIEDGRKKGKEIDKDKLLELSESNRKESERLLAKASVIVQKRLAKLQREETERTEARHVELDS